MSTMPDYVMVHELSSAYDPVPRAASVLGWSRIRHRAVLNPLPPPGFSAREQSARPSLRPGTDPRPLGLRGRPRAHLDRTRARYNRNRVTEA